MWNKEEGSLEGAMTLRKTKFSIMALSITIKIRDTHHNNKNMTLSITIIV
jgi:hypothetical protein